MDPVDLKEKIVNGLKKYRYGILILVIGLVLMMLPDWEETPQPAPTDPVTVKEETSQEEELAQILSKIQGAGKVEVMLSPASGEETLYQTDGDHSAGDASTTTRQDTVTVTDAERNETGLVRQVNPPTYLGAIVVCQGADNDAVKLAIVEAVSKVTGLGTDRISVLKMK